MNCHAERSTEAREAILRAESKHPYGQSYTPRLPDFAEPCTFDAWAAETQSLWRDVLGVR